MEKFSIRQFEEKDIDLAYRLNLAERWNDTKNDVKRMFNYEPEGCFVAQVNDEPVGHVFSVNYGRLGWIGMLIVKAEYRRMGIGTLLTKKAMDYLLSRGIETIKLEAVPEIANLYRKLGFTDEYDSLRFKGTCKKTVYPRNNSAMLMKKKIINELAEFDSRYFGADRTRVLIGLYQENPERCFVSYTGSKIAGYIMSHKLEMGYKVGPWICNPKHSQIARELLAKCMETLGHNTKLYVGVPAVNKTDVEILRKFGFEQYSKSIRMRFGKELNECVNGIFAIGGPEKG